MILVDIVYLSTFGKIFFIPMLEIINRKVQFKWYAAILCYILIVLVWIILLFHKDGL